MCLAVGAAFGTSKSGIGIAGLGTFKPELVMKVRSTCYILYATSAHMKLLFGNTSVTNTCCHVWYHRGIWIGRVCANRWLMYDLLSYSLRG